ncbi:MAG: NAD-dependent epimerase/dehydratase family protein [Candidatus Fermentibacter sp.]|nr:NAD-dependent epimerase/dehydratase family protein [Candidatus Fermentibacter sp.]
MKKAFLTGVTGFLGLHLARTLAAEGWEVSSVCRDLSDTSGVTCCSRIDRIEMLDPSAYGEAIRGADAVFHLAGATSARSREAFDRANAAVTAAVLEARRLFSPEARFIYVSSLSAGGPAGSGPLTPYGRSKLLAESIVKRGTGWVVVQPPAVFGPGDDAMAPLFRNAAKGLFPSPWGRGGTPLVYGPDLAGFLALAAVKPSLEGMVFEPSYGRAFTWEDIRALLQQAAGRRVTRVALPPPLVLAAGWISGIMGGMAGRSQVFDLHKAREMVAKGWNPSDPKVAELTGWSPPTPPDEAFSKTMEWVRQRL